MAYFALVDDANGRLLSLGSVDPGPQSGRIVVTLPDRPNLKTVMWDEATRAFVPRPQPVWVSRLDDIQTAFQADADFMAAWASLTPALRTRLRTGTRLVLASILGSQANRTTEQSVGLD